MDHERFREWFSHVDELTTAQCKEVAAVLSDPPVRAEAAAGLRLIWSALPQVPENHRKKPSIFPNVGEACRSTAGLSFIVDLRHREQTRREPLHGL